MITAASATQNQEPGAKLTLKACLGKFVYVRGATTPLHFMELKPFQVDDAIDYSHLFYVRALRARIDESAFLEGALKKWMDGTAVQMVAEAVVHVMSSLGTHVSIAEFSPGVGLTGEYVKLLLESGAAQGVRSSTVERYVGFGAAAGRDKFEILHKDAGCEAIFCDEATALSVDAKFSNHVMVFNQNQGLRMDDPGICSLTEFLALRAGAKVIALRVTTGEAAAVHTTVKGRIVELPAVAAVTEMLRGTGQAWHTRFVHGFDEGFLIPDGGKPCGLLIGYLGSTESAPLGKFMPVTASP